MSRRGNCHDNAVAESFFQLLKRERIKKRIYSTRGQARADIFNYIEIFYNVKRKHGSNNLLSPVNFENQYREQLGCDRLLVAIHLAKTVLHIVNRFETQLYDGFTVCDRV
jgi:putative transposase